MTDKSDELDQRLISTKSYSDELTAESALRPNNLSEFVGQVRVKEQLGLVLAAAAGRNSNPDHILLAGPPGLGKTTLAMIIASEINSPLRITSGPTIQHAGDLASILSSLVSGEVLFIDEIHRMSRAAQELLYVAMEDFRVDVMVGKGPGATSIPLELPPFTLVGATTRSGLLPAPLRDRFGFTAHLDFYEQIELIAILKRSATQLELVIDEDSAYELAKRSRGTPRIANRLLRRVRDYGQVHHSGSLSLASTKAALELYEVDDLGLDRLDRAVLTALIDNFNGGPVGLSTLALAVGEEPETIDFVCEPFLVRNGFLTRTPRGRQATSLAYQALNRKPPVGSELLLDFQPSED
jgi:Holliday junction DNA helicase RuvB